MDLQALPTDAELKAAGFLHAPAYLSEMRDLRPGEYEGFLATRGGSWGPGRPRQPLARCVDHLLHMVVAGCVPQRKVDGTEPLPPLTEKEAVAFCKTFVQS